ncbi:MAG: peptidylprolyl isomerase [Magnetococcales bacterium]|nr:peptidylprolyl isomerase [Magnetococcales bacterium]
MSISSDSSSDSSAPYAPTLRLDASFDTLANPRVTLKTTLGSVAVELNPNAAPVTVANMVGYVRDGFYNHLLFHRVIPGFMVQGGGFGSGLAYKVPTYAPIPLESNNGLSNLRGTIAMARTSSPNSATAQFFINQVDNTFLNYAGTASPGYAVFGQVVAGMSVIDEIAQTPTTSVGYYDDVPVADIEIVAATLSRVAVSLSITGTIAVGTLETGARWEYSIDGGQHWATGSGSRFTLPVGTYRLGAVQVRQSDEAGNRSVVARSTAILVVDGTAAVVGTSGNDPLSGTSGADALHGLEGGDVLNGLGGADRLYGWAGDDSMNGGSGADQLIGGAGRDQLTGGIQADRFKWLNAGEGGDTVTDFNAVQGDALVFVSPNFGNLPEGALGVTRFRASSTGTATTLAQRFLFNTSTGVLRYDPDGSGAAAAVTMVTLNHVRSLSNSQIVLVAG